MLWRARNELACIKTLLEKEFQIVSWDLFGFCSHPWLPNTDLEIKLWKVEGGPAQMSALGWFREPPMSLNLNLDSWQRMTKSQQLEMRRLGCQRHQALASSWSTLSHASSWWHLCPDRPPASLGMSYCNGERSVPASDSKPHAPAYLTNNLTKKSSKLWSIILT